LSGRGDRDSGRGGDRNDRGGDRNDRGGDRNDRGDRGGERRSFRREENDDESNVTFEEEGPSRADQADAWRRSDAGNSNSRGGDRDNRYGGDRGSRFGGRDGDREEKPRGGYVAGESKSTIHRILNLFGFLLFVVYDYLILITQLKCLCKKIIKSILNIYWKYLCIFFFPVCFS
jgi:hypothetical protein